MVDLPGAADSIKAAPHYRGHLTPLVFGEVWGEVESAAPAILLIPGFGGVIDEPLREVARSFWRTGLCALVVDRPRFGLSGGEPRGELDPEVNVTSFAELLNGINRGSDGQVGVWGTSFGAAEALMLAERDERVKAVVAQAPPRAIRRDVMVQKELERTVALDTQRRAEGHSPKSIPLVSDKPNAICAMPGAGAWNHLTKVATESWRNEITVRSLLLCSQVDSGELLRQASVPVCVIGIRNDPDALSEDEIPETVEKVFFEGEHYDIYGSSLNESTSAAVSFFKRQFAKTS